MADILCPEGCGVALPVMSFTDCNPEVYSSELEWLLMALPTAAPIDDVNSLQDWQTRISNTGSDPDAIRMIRIIGDMPAPTSNPVTISGGRQINTTKQRVVNFDVDETNQANWDGFRALQCGGNYRFWFVTASGHILGGEEGILGSINHDAILARGEQAIQLIQGQVTWKSRFYPERSLWPMAGATLNQLGSPAPVTASNIGQTDLDLAWNGVPNATSYTWEQSSVADFSIVDDTGTVTAPTVAISGLTASTTYYFRVKGTAAGFSDGVWAAVTATTTT